MRVVCDFFLSYCNSPSILCVLIILFIKKAMRNCFYKAMTGVVVNEFYELKGKLVM